MDRSGVTSGVEPAEREVVPVRSAIAGVEGEGVCGLVSGLFLKSSLRASMLDPLEPVANLTLTLERDGADEDRHDCLDTLDMVRRRDMIGTCGLSVSGVFGALDGLAVWEIGEGIVRLPSTSGSSTEV